MNSTTDSGSHEVTCDLGCVLNDPRDIEGRPDWLPREATEHTTSHHASRESAGGRMDLRCTGCEKRFVTSHGLPHDCECGQVMVYYGNGLFAWPATVFPSWSIPDLQFWRDAHAPESAAEMTAATPNPGHTSSDRAFFTFVVVLAAIVLPGALAMATGVTGAWFFLALTFWGVAVSSGLMVFGAVTHR